MIKAQKPADERLGLSAQDKQRVRQGSALRESATLCIFGLFHLVLFTHPTLQAQHADRVSVVLDDSCGRFYEALFQLGLALSVRIPVTMGCQGQGQLTLSRCAIHSIAETLDLVATHSIAARIDRAFLQPPETFAGTIWLAKRFDACLKIILT